MATYSTNQFKSGLKIMLDGDPYVIVSNEFVKPGKGQAFSRVKVRNLKTGRVVDRTYKSGESVEAADVMDTEMQYLYTDGEFWHFMVPDTFEQHAAGATAMEDADMPSFVRWNTPVSCRVNSTVRKAPGTCNKAATAPGALPDPA